MLRLIKTLITGTAIFSCAALAGGCAGDSESALDEFATASDFRRIAIDSLPGPAFASVADMDLDGQSDLLISLFGKGGVANGEVRIYSFDDDIATWSYSTVVGPEDEVKFPNHASAEDIDGDGDLDVFVPHGFLACAVPFVGPGDCGGLRWYENDDGAWVAHEIVPNGSKLFYHEVEFVDFDGDGIKDIVTTGEQKGFFFGRDRAEAQWFKGIDGPERFETEPRVIGAGMGSLPTVRDLDNDGDLDIASAEFFAQGDASFAWFERVAEPDADNPAGEFVHHTIDSDSGPSIQLTFVDDLYGDGVTRAIGANHTNTAKFPADKWESAIFAFEIPSDPTQPWIKTQLSSGIESRAGSPFSPQGAPGIFGTGDIDGDGDTDILVSGDGDPNVYWLEQLAPGDFATRIVAENLGQAGAMQIADFDNDGINDLIVSSYDADTLEVFQFKGQSAGLE